MPKVILESNVVVGLKDGTRLELSQGEQDVTPEVAKILKTEGLIVETETPAAE